MDDKRPAWPHKEMTEVDFRAIRAMGHIMSVEARWEMTSADTAREWLEVETRSGGTYTLPVGWHRVLKFVGHASVPGLFALTYEGEQMARTLDKIDAWEKANRDERAAYERLKAKFEGECR
jgi:hypothetical protein